MSKFTETEYVSRKGILKFPDHYVAMPVMVDDAGVTPDEHGKKIVKAGTIVGGKNGSVFSSLNVPVMDKVVVNVDTVTNEDTVTAAGAEGVLMYDVDVTYGPKDGAMIVHGFIKIDALPYGDPAKVVVAVQNGAAQAFSMIKFVK